MKNNRGLSLIEVIIVIAIMAVVAGAGLSFMNIYARNDVKQCANKLASTISKVRVDAMSKSKDSSGTDFYFQLVQRASDGKYIINHMSGVAITSVEEIGNNSLTITVVEQGATAANYSISSSNALTITFDRSTGGFRPIDGTNYCKEIIISKGSTTKKIILAPRTGKVTVE